MPASDKPRDREAAELAALADGSLPPERRRALEERVAASARLQTMLAEQQRALERLRARNEPAPEALRRRLIGLSARPARSRRRLAVALGASAALAVLFFVVPGSQVPSPTLVEAASLATLEPTSTAPRPSAAGSGVLDVEIEGLRYPDLSREYGWRAIGSRLDPLGDRSARTVFYAKRGRRVAYTVVSGAPLATPEGATLKLSRGTMLHALELGGRPLVTWRRRGHTCILSGARLGTRTLLRLASWKDHSALLF